MTPGDFKQALIQDYNTINLQVFGVGAVRQRIDIVGDKLILITENKRVPSLAYLMKHDRFVGEVANHGLVQGLKRELSRVLTDRYRFRVAAIFKDYDDEAELSCTVVKMDGDVLMHVEKLDF